MRAGVGKQVGHIVKPATYEVAVPTVFFYIDPATAEISTLSLHDALPISINSSGRPVFALDVPSGLDSDAGVALGEAVRAEDRKSTRLNSSHVSISYAVFCLKKKKVNYITLDDGYSPPKTV